MLHRFAVSALAAAVLVGAPALAANVDVNVTCCSFSPSIVTIDAGDTVTWHYINDLQLHTATNGTAPTDPNAGLLFDAPLDALNPTFVYQFNTSGDYPYFCRPHFFMLMRGTVRVRCAAGDVNTGSGAREDVLLVNGSAGDANRAVQVGVGQQIDVTLNASSSGPSPLRYVTWVWAGGGSSPVTLASGAATLGCAVNPTPFQRMRQPQPAFCLRAAGLPVSVCRGVRSLPAPPNAPFTVSRPQGLSRPLTFTLQAVVEDAGAANASGFSISNAVILQVQ